MAASTLDTLSPSYAGKALIKLSPADVAPARVNASFELAMELLDEALVQGLVLPLEMTVKAPSESNFRREVFRRVVPSAISFTPREGGEHNVVIRESFHNGWFGRIIVDVMGDRLTP